MSEGGSKVNEIEKAIIALKDHLQVCKDNTKDRNINFLILKGAISYSDKEKFKLHEQEQQKIYETAISALEKQLPKKPTIINYETNVCPECQCALFRWYSNCPDCGQKLDWEA